MTEPSTMTAPRYEVLDGLRGFASFYILVHHYVRVCIDPWIPGASRPLIFGQAAVMLFFLLSGFVIYVNTAGKNPRFTASWYLVRRFRRIYPPFLVALMMTVLLAALSMPHWRLNYGELLGNVAMLQDRSLHPGWWFKPFAGNEPLWSLAYEWWFYIVFLLIWRIGGDRPHMLKYYAAAVGFGGMGMFFLWPSQPAVYLAFFPTWWVGAELAREWIVSRTITLRRQVFPLAVVAVIGLLWLLAPVCTGRSGEFSLYGYPVIQFRQCMTVLGLVATGYAIHRSGWSTWQILLRPFRLLAPISFAIYIMHMPFIQYAARAQLTPNGLTDLLWVVPALFGLSWLVEGPLQSLVNRHVR
jgi:peptidoglycan/LPS O-acetylase OafA/YrhL